MFDAIVVGGGPSGLTAALNIRRNGKSCLILEKENFGGQIANSPKVENIPGIDSISGLEFSDKLFSQVTEKLNTEYNLEDVLKIEKIGNHFKVTTDYSTYESYSVIIASGVKHRKINVAHEDELIGKGVSYCAVCDGAFYKDEDICLIGDANTALQYALLLSQYCKHVYLNTLFDKFFADKILVDQLAEHKNIIIEHNLSLKEFKFDKDLNGVVFTNTQTQKEESFAVKACFIAIGQVPDNERFKDLVELEKGYIAVDKNMCTKTPGVYAIGDCTTKSVRQLTTAFNDAAIAAFYASAYVDVVKMKEKK